MIDRRVEQRPSETALFTALRRTLAYLEYKNTSFGPDHLAQYFLPPLFRFLLKFKKIRVNVKEKLAAAFPGLTEYIIARTAFFDRLFIDALEQETPQIVLLGAGYDSRAYRFAELCRCSQVFELDIAPTQERKKKCLKSAHIAVPPWVRFVRINFNQEPLDKVWQAAGYQKGEKTLFIWEGVSYYLDIASVDATLNFARCSGPGSQIGFDYMVTLSEENQDQYYGAAAYTQSMRAAHPSEAIRFSLGEGKIGPFLTRRGLVLIDHLDAGAIESRYLAKTDNSILGRVTGHFRLVVAGSSGEVK
jgi:methyltransferase (TIGR00027 family)